MGNSNVFTEYNIGSGSVSKTYNLNPGEHAFYIYYSEGRDYLWMGTFTSNGQNVKMVSFDTSTGSRVNEIPMAITMGIFKGNVNGDGFIGMDIDKVFYNVDKSGNKKIIRNFSFIFSQLQSL